MGVVIGVSFLGGIVLGIQGHKLYLRKLHKLSVKITRIQRGR